MQKTVTSILGKVTLSLSALLVAWVAMHWVWDSYDDIEERYRRGRWIADQIMWLINTVVSLACMWGLAIVLIYLWSRNKNR